MNPYTVFKLTEYGEEIKQQLHLRLSEWDVLSSIDGTQPLSGIMQHLDLSSEIVHPIIEQLLSYGIIEEQTVSYQEYLRLSNRPKQIPITERASQPEIPIPRSLPPLELPPLPTNHGKEVPSIPATSSKALSVSALIDFIVKKAASNTEGQIAVYRVFLRVPPELLKKNHISSLSLVNDETIVEDPELQQALSSAVEQTLQISLPDSIFV